MVLCQSWRWRGDGDRHGPRGGGGAGGGKTGHSTRNQCIPNKGIHLVCVFTAEQKGVVQGHFPEAVRRKVQARYLWQQGVPGGKSWTLTLREGAVGLEPRAPGAVEKLGRAAQQYGFYSKWKLLSRKLVKPGFICRSLLDSVLRMDCLKE